MLQRMNNQKKHMAAWLVVPFLAIANGAIREATYGRVLPKAVAHNLAMVPLLLIIFGYAFYVGRRWPLEDRRAATQVGLVWLGLTVAFEFGMGAVTGTPLRQVVEQYNILQGSLWPLAPLSMGIAPELVRRLQQRRPRGNLLAS